MDPSLIALLLGGFFLGATLIISRYCSRPRDTHFYKNMQQYI